jgi:SAM-dependent methyltransferase
MSLFGRSRRLYKDPDYKTVQTLGEHTYAIPRVADPFPTVKDRLVAVAKFLLSPLFSVPLSLLVISPRFVRFTVVSKFLPLIMKSLDAKLRNQRSLLLQHVKGKVLDVGSGGGIYMNYLNRASHIVALEPMRALHPVIMQSAKKAGVQGTLQLTSDTLEDYVRNNPSEHGTFDWIVLGNVLCEVPDTQTALDCVHALLKSGGHVYFCEHIASPRGSWKRLMQNVVNPAWTRVSAGCHCNRESLYCIQGMPHWDTVVWTMRDLSVVGGPMVLGLAQKVEPNI